MGDLLILPVIRVEKTGAVHGAERAGIPTLLPYIYRWERQGRKGQRCMVTARGTMNSCCVEFEDGYRMITSRNALLKIAVTNSPATLP